MEIRRLVVRLVAVVALVIAAAGIMIIAHNLREEQARLMADRFHHPTIRHCFAIESEFFRIARLLWGGPLADVPESRDTTKSAIDRISIELAAIRTLQDRYGDRRTERLVIPLESRYTHIRGMVGETSAPPLTELVAELVTFLEAVGKLESTHNAVAQGMLAERSLQDAWEHWLLFGTALLFGIAGLVISRRLFRLIGKALIRQQRIETALRESEETLRQVTDHIREVFWVSAPHAETLYFISPAYEDIWGRSTASLYKNPRSFVEAIHQDDRQRVIDGFTDQVAGREEHVSEYRVVRPDGSIRWIRNRAFPILDGDGKIHRLVGVAADITKRREAELALAESERRYRMLTENAPDPIFLHDTEGRFLNVNQQACDSLGYTREEFLSMSVKDITVDLHPELRQDLWRRLRTDGHIALEVLHRRKDGTTFPVEVSVVRFSTEEGEERVIGQARDITERIQAEEERIRYQEQLAHVMRLSTLGEMASGLAHEINQPLSAITNFAHGTIERLHKGTPGAARDTIIQQGLEQIATQAERAGDIVRHIRGMVKKEGAAWEAVDINTLLRRSVRLMRPECRQAGVRVRERLDAGIPPVHADRIQVDQVLVNLMRNAIEAMAGEDGTRELTLSTAMGTGDMVEIAVADTGHGISKDTEERLFHPFFTTREDGLGIGLSLSQSIVDRHGGRISARPNPEGGVTVRFLLPIYKEKAHAAT